MLVFINFINITSNKKLNRVLLNLQKEEWYSLSGITPIGEWGSLRLKIRYLNDLIMPLEEYSPLKELLLDGRLEAVRALADVCHSNRTTLAHSLLRIFQYVFIYSFSHGSYLLIPKLLHV